MKKISTIATFIMLLSSNLLAQPDSLVLRKNILKACPIFSLDSDLSIEYERFLCGKSTVTFSYDYLKSSLNYHYPTYDNQNLIQLNSIENVFSLRYNYYFFKQKKYFPGGIFGNLGPTYYMSKIKFGQLKTNPLWVILSLGMGAEYLIKNRLSVGIRVEYWIFLVSKEDNIQYIYNNQAYDVVKNELSHFSLPIYLGIAF